MSYDEVGKGAKRMGLTHARDRRRIDAVSPLSHDPPKVLRTTKPPREFGYELRTNHLSFLFGKTHIEVKKRWFRTAAHRDQAMAHERRWHDDWNLKWFRTGHKAKMIWELTPMERSVSTP